MWMHGRTAGLAGILIVVLPGLAAAQPRDLRGYPDPTLLDRYNLKHRWTVQVPLVPHREKITSLKVREGLVFVQSNKGLIHSIEGETGRLLWTTTVAGIGGVVYPPALTDQFVYVSTGTTLSQLDRVTGQLIWQKEMPAAATAGPGANNEFVYVPLTDQRLYAFALNDDYNRVFTKRPIAWTYNVGESIVNPPVVLPDRVAFEGGNGILYAANLNKGDIFYRFYTYSRIAAPIATLNRIIYLATTDYNLYALDLRSGQIVWRFPAGFPITRRPEPFQEDVYVIPEGEGLHAIDNLTGQLKWVNPKVSRVIAVSQSNVYAATRYNDLMIVSRADGATRGRWPAPAFTISTDNQYTDRAYLATEDGLIICLHEKQNEQPYLHPQSPPKEVLERIKEAPAAAAKADKTKDAAADLATPPADAAAAPKRGFFDDEPKPAAEAMPGEAEPKPAAKKKSFFDD